MINLYDRFADGYCKKIKIDKGDTISQTFEDGESVKGQVHKILTFFGDGEEAREVGPRKYAEAFDREKNALIYIPIEEAILISKFKRSYVKKNESNQLNLF